MGALRACQKGLNRKGSMGQCSDFCTRFNPVRFNKHFEGELDKLAFFGHFMEREVNRLEERRLHQLARLKENQKRLLAETGVERQGVDTGLNEVSQFNKAFHSSLVPPIPYRFKEDMTIKHSIRFDEPIFKYSSAVLFNLVDFRGRLDRKGLDFFKAGESAKVTREAAEKVFELMNPAKGQGADLEAYLKTAA